MNYENFAHDMMGDITEKLSHPCVNPVISLLYR